MAVADDRSARYSPAELFGIMDGSLAVGGVPITRLAARVGSTPFFAYDRSVLAARIERLRECLPDRIALHYAVKANPMPAVVQHLSGLIDGFDVASAGELRTVLDTPMPAAHVGFAGPGKTAAELRQAIASGVKIEIESEGELARIISIAESGSERPRVAIRINPDFQVKGSAMRMGGGSAAFGVDAERVPDLLARVAPLDFEFTGFHVFCGSQNLDAEIIASTQAQTIELAIRLAEGSDLAIAELNIGGGFGIPYFPKDAPLDLPTVGTRLGDVLARHTDGPLADTRIIIELGRYIVGEAGVYVTRILDRKVSRDAIYLVTDGGMHHQLAASGNFGQVIRRNYPVAIANRIGESPSIEASIVGCLCTPLDLLADKVELPDAREGDLVVVFQSGAYGLTASPTAFLGHPAPLEVLV